MAILRCSWKRRENRPRSVVEWLEPRNIIVIRSSGEELYRSKVGRWRTGNLGWTYLMYRRMKKSNASAGGNMASLISGLDMSFLKLGPFKDDSITSRKSSLTESRGRIVAGESPLALASWRTGSHDISWCWTGTTRGARRCEDSGRLTLSGQSVVSSSSSASESFSFSEGGGGSYCKDWNWYGLSPKSSNVFISSLSRR